MDFFSLRIKKIISETPDTKTFEFEIPDTLIDRFAYKQGQYVTLRADIDGESVRRSYSMSSSPLENRLAVTVKKIEGGRMSNWLHENLEEGRELAVAPPEGRFYNELDPEKRRTYYFFGAGSGITPLMSIARTILEGEPMSAVFLLYGSRDEEHIIFLEALDAMSERYAGQFFVEHILSRPAKRKTTGGLLSFFKKSSVNWSGQIGRVDARTAVEFLNRNEPQTPLEDCLYYICGPGDMADNVRAALQARGIAPKQIYTEYFVNAGQTPGAGAPSGDRVPMIVHLKGQVIELDGAKETPVLDSLVAAKYDPPYSCTSGACSTCMAKVLKGSVKMDVCYALDDAEIKAGFCLTCQAKPTSEALEITYDY